MIIIFCFYCKIWYFVVNSNVGKNWFAFAYIFSSPSKRNESQVKHILGCMIKSWLWSWLAPPRHQLVKFHHVTWSHQAAMILRTSARLFCKGLNIKRPMLLNALSILEIYSDWTQACLIYIVWSTRCSHKKGFVSTEYASTTLLLSRQQYIKRLERKYEYMIFIQIFLGTD